MMWQTIGRALSELAPQPTLSVDEYLDDTTSARTSGVDKGFAHVFTGTRRALSGYILIAAFGLIAFVAGFAFSHYLQTPPTYVRFSYHATDAQSVSVIGDFNGWDERTGEMHPSQATGYWEIWMPMPPGRYRYVFVVDRKQTPDPLAAERVHEDHGRMDYSIVNVPRIRQSKAVR
jgi:hypothetical protein